MTPMYGQERVAHALADEACRLEGDRRKAWISGYREILADAACRAESLERLRQATPESFFVLPETADIARTFITILPDLKVKEQKQEIKILQDEAAKAFKKGDFQSTINQLDALLSRFGNNDDPALRKTIARALLNKGVTLGRLKENEEAIAAFEELIGSFSEADDPALREAIARGFFYKGAALDELGRREEAIAVYDDLIGRFGEADVADLREEVAHALLHKGIDLGRLKRAGEAIAVYDELIRRFGEADNPALHGQVAYALFNKGVDLDELGRIEEAIAVYDELIRRFGKADESLLRKPVVCALCKKSLALGKLGRGEEEIAVHDDLLRRFAATSDPALRKPVACALNIRAWSVYEKKNNSMVDQAILDVKKAIEIYPQDAYRHTLASLFALASQWGDAFAQARLFADDDLILSHSPDDVIDFFVYAASSGKAEEALRAIKGTKAESVMEPLVVALKMAAGKPFRAPQEVVEVAKDVLKRIEERARMLE